MKALPFAAVAMVLVTDPAAGSEGVKARPPVVEFSWRPPPINVITAPAESAVAGRIEQESSGRGYIALTAEGVALDLGQDVLQVVACPTGKVVYVIIRPHEAITVADLLHSARDDPDRIGSPQCPARWASATNGTPSCLSAAT